MVFERISIIFDLNAYLENVTFRGRIIEHTGFKMTKGGELTHRLSISNVIERITNINNSKGWNRTKKDERRRFKAFFRKYDTI